VKRGSRVSSIFRVRGVFCPNPTKKLIISQKGGGKSKKSAGLSKKH
jgi:hypothetical protein